MCLRRWVTKRSLFHLDMRSLCLLFVEMCSRYVTKPKKKGENLAKPLTIRATPSRCHASPTAAGGANPSPSPTSSPPSLLSSSSQRRASGKPARRRRRGRRGSSVSRLSGVAMHGGARSFSCGCSSRRRSGGITGAAVSTGGAIGPRRKDLGAAAPDTVVAVSPSSGMTGQEATPCGGGAWGWRIMGSRTRVRRRRRRVAAEAISGVDNARCGRIITLCGLWIGSRGGGSR